MAESLQTFQDLMERVRQGSPEASQQLLDRYGHHILHVVRRTLHAKLRTKFDSLDFVQDVWASFFTGPQVDMRFETPEGLAAFLAKVARNKVVEAFRQRMQGQKYNVNRENSLDGSAAFQVERLVGADPTGSQLAVANEAYEGLTRGQPDHYRRILELLQQGHTHQEIAEALGLNEKTIRRLIRKLEDTGA
jgi:RNA polymerase sigma-70 factor (ECF subfamily)